MVRVFREGKVPEELDSAILDEKKISAIDSKIRRDILELISKEPSFPAEIARELDLEKQKTYYHFQKLEGADLIEKVGERNYSGGTAQLFDIRYGALSLDLGADGKKTFLPSDDNSVRDFLSPLIEEGRINGKIVVGSSEKHGEDQVRAQDGHLAGEISAKLGNYARAIDTVVTLDTELTRSNQYDQNLIILGGILTNTAAKKFNGAFPVKFSGEDFPYREIETPESTYEGSRVGFIAKTRHPDDPDKSIFIIAGVRREGTRAAVEAFKQLETTVKEYEKGNFYTVVEGIDRSGDGRIDSFEIVETGF